MAFPPPVDSQGAEQFADSSEGGRWITANDTHIHLDKSGSVDAGPERLTGKPLGGGKSPAKPTTKTTSPAGSHEDHKATLREIADAHITEKAVGPAFNTLYAKAKAKHPEMTKEDFRVAMHDFHSQGEYKLGGWPRMHDDLPDPDLAVHVGGEKTRRPREQVDRSKAPDLDVAGRLMYYLQPASGVVSKHSETTNEPAGQAPDQTALHGHDGGKVESLLEHAQAQGISVLGDVTRSALERLIKSKPAKIATATELFNKAERQQLADALAEVNSTANLLGRSRVRLRQQRAEQLRGIERFSEHPTNFQQFDEIGPLKPMPPEDALAYFRRLVPRVGVDPHQFATDANREAFTMAQATEETLLAKCKGLIETYLEQGGVEAASGSHAKKHLAEHLDDILTDAGVHPSNPQYSDMVIRTNLKDAYNVGADQERQNPDVVETFPVWMYVGIKDGREGDDHRPMFGKYYPSEATFAEVRGDRPFNCRCDQIPVDKWEWAEMQARGKRVETNWSRAA